MKKNIQQFFLGANQKKCKYIHIIKMKFKKKKT